MPLPGG